MFWNLVVLWVSSNIVSATLPDCAVVPVSTSYVKEDCFNATHRRMQSGKCINGQLQEEKIDLVSCSDYIPSVVLADDEVLANRPKNYCHSCQDNRVVCSEVESRPQACAAHENDYTMCRQVQSVASLTGCLTSSNYYTAIEYCKTTTATTGNDDHSESDATITSTPCAETYGSDFQRCLSCRDGLRVCHAGAESLECPDIGLPLPEGSNGDNGDENSESGGDNAVDGTDGYGSFDCSQFWGDVQFYKDECLNQTHRVVTSGICFDGQVQALSFETTPCTDDGEGMEYCHDCNGKAVCADTSVKFNLCDEHDKLRGCSSYYDRSSHWAGCADELSFALGADSCRDGQGLMSERTLQCGEQFQGFPFCVFEESDNYQLCSTVPVLPPPSVECEELGSDTLWSKFECFNETHTLYRSARCIDGKISAPMAKVEACGGYCHQCADGLTTVCSTSDNAEIACIPPTDGAMCDVSGTAAFTSGCLDEENVFEETQTCSNGQIGTDRSNFRCSSKYYKTPKCLACKSASFCAESGATCTTFGSTPLATNPGSGPDTQDGVRCPDIDVKINYYKESCYNATHVRATQGECDGRNKTRAESTLIACSAYGEDESRIYCHECGVSVACSNSPERQQACERSHHDRTCDASVSDLRGSFGCLDDSVFFTEFGMCLGASYTSEINGFRCADSFPGHGFCNTCGSLNLCIDKRTSCSELGF